LIPSSRTFDSPLDILLAEDDPVTQRLIRGILERFGYAVQVVADGKQAFETIRTSGVQFLITDWVMPEMEGPDLCKRIREEIRDRYIYIILLTARAETADIISGIEAGADDYLVKPFEPDELLVRIRAGQRVITLERRLNEAQEQLRFLAFHDDLTGLLNRRAVLDRLREEIARSGRQDTPLSVIFFDIDHFKRINDTYGHLAGDRILKGVAERVGKLCRAYDVFGRYGGEEFVILMPGTSQSAAACVAERIRRALAAEPILTQPEAIGLTASFGVCEMTSDREVETDLIMKSVDEALYRAKEGGRNRVCVAGDDILSTE